MKKSGQGGGTVLVSAFAFLTLVLYFGLLGLGIVQHLQWVTTLSASELRFIL